MAIRPIDLGKTAAQDENSLVAALRRMGLDKAGDNIRTLMIETVADKAYEICKATAPVGGDRDPHPGQLRDSIYKEVEQGKYLIRGKVAIPTSIPYRFAVIFGDKRHTANRFMEAALVKAMEYMKANFSEIVRKAFGDAKK